MQGEITKHGVVHLLRKGVDHLGQHIDLCYPTATEGNATAADSFAANRFVITGQVHHSPSNRGEAVDLVAFVNGLPVFTFESKKLLTNASHFAFTATPKNKTLEKFGEAIANPDGTIGHRPFHSYTMKQAIQEGFIVDVLANYTPVDSYYKLMKTVEDDPEFDVKRASKKLRTYVEGNQHAIAQKADIMVEHFLGQVITK